MWMKDFISKFRLLINSVRVQTCVRHSFACEWPLLPTQETTLLGLQYCSLEALVSRWRCLQGMCDPSDRNESLVGKLYCWETAKYDQSSFFAYFQIIMEMGTEHLTFLTSQLS